MQVSMATDPTTIAQSIETRAPTILAVTSIFLALSTTFVALRMVSRIAIVRKTGQDDYFMLAAWAIGAGMSISIIFGTQRGLGRHEVDVPETWGSALRKSEYAFSVLYNPALMMTKTSILIFYLSLSKSRQIFRWSTIATLVVVNAAGFALTILNIVQCRPVSAAFEPVTPPGASCTDIVTLYLSSAPVNIITDLAILVLPMPILTSMRLPRKQKAILIITFSFGVFVTAIDVVRIAYLQQAATNRLRAIQEEMRMMNESDPRDAEANDFSWYAGLSFMWSAIEVHVGIMCACVPALKPLVARFLPTLLRDDSLNDRTGLTTSSPHTASLELRNPAAQDPSLQRPPPVKTGDDANRMDMMDFLTTPDMNELPTGMNRTQTALTNTTRHTQPPQQTFFDFVNIRKDKSMVHYTTRESVFPFVMVTGLFFIWGFSYTISQTLSNRFVEIAGMSDAQSVGIHSAYFGGYLAAPLTFGRLVLKHWGFKACYIVGLIIYACGTLIFWPAAVLTSFPAFLISNFVVGLGLSTLEIAANPFITLIGPARYGEARLNLSQAIQGIGSVVSPLLARKVLFKADADSLIDAQWAYLGISLFTFLLALGYYYVPLPEATDDELEDAAERYDSANHATLFNVRYVWITLAIGVFSQFCYVGGQEVIATSFASFINQVMPQLEHLEIDDLQAIAHTVFAFSRFAAGIALIYIKPRHVLIFFYLGSIAFAAASMTGSGATATTLLTLLFFFEGPLFSTIFAMSLRGMGRGTKDAASLLTAAISGGAVFPPISYATSRGHSTQYAMSTVVVATFAAGAVFALWTEFVPQVRLIVDPLKNPSEPNSDDEGSGGVGDSPTGEKRSSFVRGMKRRIKEVKDEMPRREHRERTSWPSNTGSTS